MSGWFLIAIYLLIAVLALPLSTDVPSSSGAADLVHPAPGHPLSLEQTEERSQMLQGGASAREVEHSRVYRDSVGRVRIDSDVRKASGESSIVRTAMIDPSTGLRTVILNDVKLAYRIHGPKAGENGFALGWAGMGESLAASHKWVSKTEHLGNRVIDGVEYVGTRITQVAEDEPALRNTIETWYSDRLKLTGLAVASGPYGTHTARIQNIHLGEPDPALWSIPEEYKVVDIPFHSSDQH